MWIVTICEFVSLSKNNTDQLGCLYKMQPHIN